MKIYRIFLFLLMASATFAQEKTVQQIEITGLKRTKEGLIRKIIEVKPGTVLDSAAIKKDIERLKRMEPVAFADFEVSQNADGSVKLVYKIVENFTIIPGFNVFTTQNEEVAYRLSVFDFNFLGQNHIAGGFFLHDIFDSYGVYYEAPFLFSRSWGLSVNHINNNSLEPVFFPGNTSEFKYSNSTFEVFAIHQPDFFNRFEFGASYFQEEYDFISSASEEPVPVTNVNGDHLGFRGSWLNTNININYQYLQGREFETNLQFNTNANENLNSFFLGRFGVKYFERVGEKGNFAGRALAFYATNNDAAFAPFVLDNNLNIRGVGNRIDRGTAGLVFNTEYRHTLYEKGWFVLQGNAFVDAGAWRNPGENLGQLFDGSTLRVHPGLGVRFIHKRIFNAAVRIDYGFGIANDNARGFVIGIGQYF